METVASAGRMMNPQEIWESVLALSILYPSFLIGMSYFWYKDVWLNRHQFHQEGLDILADAERNREVALGQQLAQHLESVLVREFLI